MEIIIRGESEDIAGFLHELKFLGTFNDMPNYIPSAETSGEKLNGEA